MATFSPEVSDYKRRDNTYLIKVRVTHNRATIRKPLGVYATAEQLNRDRSRIKDAALAAAVGKIVDNLRQAAASIEFAEFMTARELWRAIQERLKDEKGFTLDFFKFADEVKASKERGTADGYKFALNAFESYLGRRECDINAIDKAMVAGFREWIEKRNSKGCRAASAYLEKLRHVHNLARERYNDEDMNVTRIPRQPFKGMIPPQPQTRHRALSLAQLRKLAAYTPKDRHEALAKDVFFLSFATIGTNTADLHAWQKSDLRAGVVTYHRAKTDSRRADKAVMCVRVEPEAADIMARHKGTRFLLDFADLYKSAANFNKYVNKALNDMGVAVGVPRLTSYYARHTWATLARNECKVSFDVVHEALNHVRRGEDKVTDIYIERDWSEVWEANRRVLDLLAV